MVNEEKISMKQFKQRWAIRDSFHKQRHVEKMTRLEKVEKLVHLRFDLSEKLATIKDKFSEKRMNRELKIIETKSNAILSKLDKRLKK
jgi:hypothetical protein